MSAAVVRVALYTRMSTDETNQPYSLGAQSDRLDAVEKVVTSGIEG